MKILFCLLSAVLLLNSCDFVQKRAHSLNQNEEAIKELNNGNLDKALALFRESLKNGGLGKEERGIVYQNMAKVFEYRQETDSIKRYLELAIKQFDPTSLKGLTAQGELDLYGGNVPRGLLSLKKAWLKDSSDFLVNNLLGLVYVGEQGAEYVDAHKAVYHARKSHESGNSRASKDLLARACFVAENYNEATKLYAELSKEYPTDNAVYLFNLGMSKYEQGQQVEAMKDFNAAIAKDSTLAADLDLYLYPEEEQLEEEPLP